MSTSRSASAMPPEIAGGPPEQSDDNRSVVMPLIGIMILIAVPFCIAVWAGGGDSVAIAAFGVAMIAACLFGLVLALVRLMRDPD